MSSLFSGVLRGFVFGLASAAQSLHDDRLHADRHDIGHPLPLLPHGNRIQTDDLLQGRSVRLPRLRPHGAPRRAGVQMHVPPLLEAGAKSASHETWNSPPGLLMASSRVPVLWITSSLLPEIAQW